ncbi:MAG TPA: hypothetical protein DCM28_15190, partial [Phycisphaerales bacterium]|nr:hypothetical protein [Phycisphaerales bacterium]
MNTLAISTRRDDTWLPTAVALILSLLLHVGVFTGMLSSWQIREQRQKQKQEDQPAEKVDQQLQVEPEKNQPQEDELLLGKDDADDILTLNWIGYEAFEKLIAMPSKTQ